MEDEAPDAEALLARFKQLLGDLYIDASRLEFISELGVGELALVERASYLPASGGRVSAATAAAARAEHMALACRALYTSPLQPAC